MANHEPPVSDGAAVCGSTRIDPVTGETHVCYLGPGHQRSSRQQEHECICGDRWPANPN